MDRSPIPLYHRLYVALSERIASGAYPPGSQLPTERSLTEEFRVSRQTVLAALQRLTADGVIERYAGRGTFVVEARAQPGRWTFDSLEDLIEAGRARHYVIVGAEMVPAESEPRLRGIFGLARD
ncbi:MAG: GntR family transcriptional regulator, partial [Bradyrhizobium sp.]